MSTISITLDGVVKLYIVHMSYSQVSCGETNVHGHKPVGLQRGIMNTSGDKQGHKCASHAALQFQHIFYTLEF
jgi:hypothetical protein